MKAMRQTETPQFVRWRTSGLILASWLACFTVARSLSGDSPPPSFLVILADDLGFSDLGCYGGEIATPNLDSLAASGLRYTQFYNTARCWPTRASLLTGYYPQQVRFDALPGIPSKNQQSTRPRWARLLPEYLRPLGYRSYHSGKWHLDGGPVGGGFDRSYSLNDHNRYFSPRDHTLDDRRLPRVERNAGYYATTAIADRAIEFLEEHAEKHNGVPFFAYVAFNSPHFPLHAVPEDIERYAHRYDAGWDEIRSQRWRRIQAMLRLPGELSALEPRIGPSHAFARTHKILGPGEVYRERAWNELSEQQREYQAGKMALHAAMVACMDREIGRLIDQLRAMRALENTVIFFFSDNGASAEIVVRGDGHDSSAAPGSANTFQCLGPGWSRAANTPFRRHKMWVHEGGIATPLIVHWPAGIRARNQLRHAVSHVIDIAPTLLSLAGGDWPTEYGDRALPPHPGKNLASSFDHDAKIDRDLLWWFHQGNRAIRVDDWKLVTARNEPWELYDLKADRAENNDLADIHPDRVSQLERMWNATAESFRELTKADRD
jgi:arylsulfatase